MSSVYIMTILRTRLFRLGVSRNPAQTMRVFQREHPRKLSLVQTYHFPTEYHALECHDRVLWVLSGSQLKEEWYDLDEHSVDLLVRTIERHVPPNPTNRYFDLSIRWC